MKTLKQPSWFFLALIPCVILALYYPVLNSYWTWDDSSILKHVVSYSPWEYFFIPDIWRELSPANLTPWVSLSFDLDVTLFGFEPAGFYAHHLLSLSLVSFALYAVLNLWLTPAWSFIGVGLWLSSAPVQTLAQQLMTRHYLEGLGFALLTLLFYVKALREQRWQWIAFSAVFYALACSAKEVYVPLIMLLPWLPEANLRRRWLFILPLGCVAGIYVIWRFYMLGVLVGGYAAPITWQTVAYLPGTIAQKLLGAPGWGLSLAVVLIMLSMLHLLWQSKPARGLLPLILFITLAPLIPVQHFLVHADTYRLLILPSAVFAAGIAFMLEHLNRHFNTQKNTLFLYACTACLFLPLLKQQFAAVQYLQPQVKKFTAHGYFIQNAPPEQTLVQGINWYETGLIWLQHEVHGKTAPRVVFEMSQIEDFKEQRFFRYNTDCACIEEVTQHLPAEWQEWKNREKPNAPLSLYISEHQRLAKWQFSPYDSGVYTVINADLFGQLPLPPQGAARVMLPEPMRFRLRYDAPEGWHTYSPWLILQHADDKPAEIRWARKE